MAKPTSRDSVCKHAPPRKHVLLLSCMDQRLLDDTVSFMDSYNLANRYDQVVFAGAALGVMNLSSPSSNGSHASWNDVFFHHLKVAIDTLGRKIKDVFILEHRDCGAYEHFHPTHKEPYSDDEAGQNLERDHHREQAFLLAAAVREFCDEQSKRALAECKAAKCDADRIEAEKKSDAWKGIKVKCFLMDLQGHVEHLCEPKAKKQPSKNSPKKALNASGRARRA